MLIDCLLLCWFGTIGLVLFIFWPIHSKKMKRGHGWDQLVEAAVIGKLADRKA
jgi:hypothetical protein